jgi:Asp-tRNA(Asn)/Glu-tRNA(Gln) amidotransferase A subunit family amidase
MRFHIRPALVLFVLALSALTELAAPGAASAQARPATSQRSDIVTSQRSDIVYEASVTELQAAMTQGRVTSVALVDAYLARINAYDHAGPALNAIVRLNPHARADAAALDAERKAGHVRGGLHGIPIILKDNYGTRDFETSAGSIALANLQTTDDAFQVKKLRDAGAVILGKSNMHELASGITTISSVGGQTCNPYDPDRSPGGSSGGSGAAVAASYAAIAFGSDTCGSIRIPSAVHNLFGLRPTKGLSSISGIVPLSHTQDVGGPLARSVMDLAIALDATVGADPADSATRILSGRPPASFVAALDSTSLRGARFGVFTEHFGTDADDQEATRVVRSALASMKARGAEVIDVAIPGLDSVINRAGVIDYEFKYDLIDYLAANPNAPIKSLSEILDRGLYDIALETGLRRRERQGTRDGDAYRAALAQRTVARDMVVAFLDSNRLDAIVYPTLRRKAALIGEPQRGANCQLSAVTGLPALSMPAGLTPDGMPIGVELLGRPLADARLVALAYDYEQSSRPRRPPSTTPALVDGRAPRPMAMSAGIREGKTVARGDFVYDATQRSLDYLVRVSGTPAGKVVAISIDRDSAGRKGPILRHLSGAGIMQSKGRLTLAESERRDLVAGHLALVVYTSDQPAGSVKGAIIAAPRR